MSLYIGSSKVTPAMRMREADIAELTITPSTTSQTIETTAGVDGYAPITVEAVTASIDPNIIPENIKLGVTILGVTGTYEG